MSNYHGVDLQRLSVELRRHFGSKAQFERKVGVSPPTASKLLRGAPVSPRMAEKVLDAGERALTSLDPYKILQPPLYELAWSYHDNMRHGPQFPIDTASRGQEPPRIPCRLWGRELNSCFGVSASCLTGNSLGIRPLAQAGADVITYKTVRTRKVDAHRLRRNIGYIIEPPEYMVPLEPSEFPDELFATDDWTQVIPGRAFLLANCFGVPSDVPSVWTRDVAHVVKTLPPGKMLILSLVGTIGNADGRKGEDELVEDFVRCVQFVADMKASRPFAIELNFSCPHTRDGGGTVYQHPALAKRITKQVRELLDSIEAPPRVLIKVGHLKREDVKRLCDATLPYIDGYTAINTKATRVLQRAELGFGVRYFDGDSGFEKAGISGVAIQKCALETIAAFADEYSRTGTKDHVIFGVGGVTSPPDVQTFLDAGADIVQATTAFMHNHRFAADVRFFLAGRQLDHERAAVKTLVAAMPESVCPKNDADEFRRYLENRLPELHKEFVQTRL